MAFIFRGDEKLLNTKATKLILIFGLNLIVVLGLSSVPPALPYIAKDFSINPSESGLIISLFAFPGILFTPVLGILADRYGRKMVLVPSLFLFSIAGTMCAFTNDFHLLLLFRFLQGSGAASLGAMTVILVADLFSEEQRATVLGYNFTVLGIFAASFPFIGGIIANYNWKYIFLLSLIALPLAIWILTLKIDYIKSTDKLSNYFKNTISFIKTPATLILLFVSMITYIILFGSFLTFTPFLVQKKFELTSVYMGLVITGMSLTQAVVSYFFGKIVKNINPIIIQFLVSWLYATGIAIFPYVKSYEMLILPILFFGVAHGLNLPNIQNWLVSIAPLESRAAIMSTNRMVAQIGQTIGPIIIGTVFYFSSEYMQGLNYTFWGGAIFALLQSVIIYPLYKQYKMKN